MLSVKSENTKDSSFRWVLLVEIASIFLSVLLAFTVENLREARNNQKMADMALESVINELEDNIKELENVLESHQIIIDSLQMVMSDLHQGKDVSSMDLLERAIFKTGFHVATVQSAAWNTANSTGTIRFFDMELANNLAKLYEWQEDGLKYNYKIFADFMFDTSRLDDEKVYENSMMFFMIMKNVQNMEKSTLENTKKMLETIQTE